VKKQADAGRHTFSTQHPLLPRGRKSGNPAHRVVGLRAKLTSLARLGKRGMAMAARKSDQQEFPPPAEENDEARLQDRIVDLRADVFLARIAFFTRLAGLFGSDATLVAAIPAFRLGFFTAGLGAPEVFLVGIAFLAGLAVLVRGDAARLGAVFAIGPGLFATGLFGGKRGNGHPDAEPKNGHQCLEKFHDFHLFWRI